MTRHEEEGDQVYGFDIKTLLLIPTGLLALTIHEFAHAYVADRLGDPTARLRGRLTINPLAHLDLLGTILIVLVGFGWAKPVPVDSRNFANPRRDMMAVAAAGPLSNVLCAVAASLLFRSLYGSAYVASLASAPLALAALMIFIHINLALAVFNLIPIPPLDGSRILYGLLPPRAVYQFLRVEPYGVIVLFALFMFGGNVFGALLWRPVSFLVNLFTGI